MPRYDFACRGCGRQWEGYAKVAARRRARCPVCGARRSEVRITGGNATRGLTGPAAVSPEYAFHPSEVMGVRRLMPDHQHCVTDRGDVKFKNVGECKTFKNRVAEVQKFVRDKRYQSLGVRESFFRQAVAPVPW